MCTGIQGGTYQSAGSTRGSMQRQGWVGGAAAGRDAKRVAQKGWEPENARGGDTVVGAAVGSKELIRGCKIQRHIR